MVRGEYGASVSLRTNLKPQDFPYTVCREGVVLSNGRVSDVFTVVGGEVCITGMWMQITEAVSNLTCLMTWVLDPELGSFTPIGTVAIGTGVDIDNAAVGDFFWNELDGTAIVKAATGTALPIRAVGRRNAQGLGVIVPVGGIDVQLSAFLPSGTGKGNMHISYIPLHQGACIFAGELHSSTTSSTSTSSTTSTTSTTTSTSSTTSTTSTTTSTSSSSSTTTTTSTTNTSK